MTLPIDTGETPDEQDNDSQDELSLEQQLEAIKAEQQRTAAALKKANRESASRRKKLEAFEQQEEERKQAEMSELEKAQQEIADLKQDQQAKETAFNEQLIRLDIQSKAAQLGFVSLDDAVQLVDKSDIVLNDDGEIEGVEEALKTLAKDKPYLLSGDAPPPKAPNLDSGAGNPPARKGGASLTADEKRIADRTGTSYEDYAKIKAQREGLYAYIPEKPERASE